MDNFDYKKFLAKGKLNEETEALDRESVVDFAQMVADAFTQEDANDAAMIYTVGKVDGLEFELDTQATENTPADDAKYGTGEGWGGSFRIKVLPNGYEIRNSEKGGLVATMDMEDGFRMLSADESRAELDGELDMDRYNYELDMKRMEEAEEAPKSNKMKKSELKEMIKAAMLAEMEVEETTVYEAEEEDVDVEADIEDVDVDMDADMDVDMDAGGSELSGNEKEISDNLEAALEAARALGDEKLVDQIGNTITFFTRAHIVKEGDMIEDEAEMELEEGTGFANSKDEYFQIHVASPKGDFSRLDGWVFPNPESADEWIEKVKGDFPKGIKKLPATPEDLKLAETQLNEEINRMKKLAGLK